MLSSSSQSSAHFLLPSPFAPAPFPLPSESTANSPISIHPPSRQINPQLGSVRLLDDAVSSVFEAGNVSKRKGESASTSSSPSSIARLFLVYEGLDDGVRTVLLTTARANRGREEGGRRGRGELSSSTSSTNERSRVDSDSTYMSQQDRILSFVDNLVTKKINPQGKTSQRFGCREGIAAAEAKDDEIELSESELERLPLPFLL